MRLPIFPILALSVLLMSCSSNATIRESFHDHATRMYGPEAVEIFDVAEYRDPAGHPRWHAVGAVRNAQGDWHLVWADYGKRGRSEWVPMEWPELPWPRAESLGEARETGARYLARFVRGEVGAGVFFAEQNMVHDGPFPQ